MDLAALIAKHGSDLRLRQAIVTAVPSAVPSGGTCTIRFGDLASTTTADDIPGVRCLVGAVNGDTVWVLQTGGALLVIGVLDTGWVNLTLLNGWVVYDNTFGPNGYSGLVTAPMLRKKAGVVYLRGLIRSGTLGTVVATLPPGFRPAIKLLFATMGDNNVINRCDVDPLGNIVNAAGASNGWSSLNGITFPADQ